jgi:hypothetical protein
MIKSFRNETPEAAWRRRFIKSVPNAIMKAAYRKLMQVNRAGTLSDLRRRRAIAWGRWREMKRSSRVSDRRSMADLLSLARRRRL